MKYCFIINLNAGKGDFFEALQSEIKNVCADAGAEYDIFASESFASTLEYVRSEAERAFPEKIAFIAAGGDGTLCKTATAVMSLPEEHRKNACVGVIPLGTGNDFVSNFFNKERFSSIKALMKPSEYEIDVIRCNDLYSVNMINIGFDSEVVCKKEEIGRRKWLPRKFAYIFSLIITLFRKPTVSMEISVDGEESEKKHLLLTTYANGAFCGGGFNSNPKAVLSDGMIDMLFVNNVGRLKFLTLVGDYKKGNHLSDKFKDIIENKKCQSAYMRFDTETPVSVDGEIIRTRELSLSIERKALRIVLPFGVTPIAEPMPQKELV